MRLCSILLLLTLTLPVSSTVNKDATRAAIQTAIPPDLNSLRESGNKLFLDGDFANAVERYKKGLQLAIARRESRAESRFRQGLGNCYLLAGDYQSAVNEYIRARNLSAAQSDFSGVSLLSMNLFTAYGRMNDYASALQSMQQVLRLTPSGSLKENLPRLLIGLASAASLAGRATEAVSNFSAAIRAADSQGDMPAVTQAWSELGSHYLRARELDNADLAYTRAFYLRKMAKGRGLADSYRDIGALRMEQRDPRSALNLLNQALLSASHSTIGFPIFNLYYRRAMAKAALDDLAGALDDFETGLELARRWRLDIVPTDHTETRADVKLQAIYAAYIETGMKLYSRQPNPALAYKMFQAAEENRAVSFRARLNAGKPLTPEYWVLLATVRKAEIALLRNSSELEENNVKKLQLQLLEVEAQLGISSDNRSSTNSHRINENNRSVKSLTPFQRIIPSHEALISFHLGEKESFVWALTRERFEVLTLPGRAQISNAVREFREAVRAGTIGADTLGQKLYIDLFGSLNPAIANKPDWVLVLDDKMFELPFAALVTARSGSNSRYLIERNSLRVIPAAAMLGAGQPRISVGPFLGIGDPIYNSADARWVNDRTSPHVWDRMTAPFHFGAPYRNEPSLELARLPGSGREIRASARAWPSPISPVLLQGKFTERTQIEERLRGGPSVAHFATHVVHPPNRPDQAMIAIGVDGAGQPDFLTITEISRWRYPLGLVVLSGCSSGTGVALPGAGLFGLTRAWLLAGAHAVTASQWPTPDDNGVLFEQFYGSFGKRIELTSSATANALRTAQIRMLRSGNWRAQPKFWAAFFVVGKD